MNQDSFRRLLEGSKSSTKSPALGVTSTSRSRLVVHSKPKNSPEVVSKPAFKPRNVKKPEDAKDHDPKTHQDKSTIDVNVSAGGSRHNATEPSSLKGLDFALLEQEKAKAGLLSTNDVDELERAFAESSASRDSEQVAPRKRTREDLIRELIQKRAETEGQSQDTNKMDALLEGAKQRSKFKPIGFTSIGKRKKDETDKKKKKRKVDTEKNSQAKHQAAFMSDTKIIPRQHQPPVDEGFDDNFDIFAGAGEYTGVDIDENEEATISPHKIEEPASLPQRWIAMDDSEQLLQAKPEVSPIPVPEDTKIASEQDQEVAMRLAPLETSAIPSIKELLEMHDAADKYDKKMKQKEKKQRKRGGNKGKASDDE